MHDWVKIRGQVQPYQWGGTDFLPRLLGYVNSAAAPQAEYWLGAHPAAPAQLATAPGTSIEGYLTEHGAPPLQFLLKILDVRDMLSIQVHPTKAQAVEGFARENALGIDLSAKNRNYKDANDKPELMVALSEFWLLHGFRSENEIALTLAQLPPLNPLRKKLLDDGLAAAFAFALAGENPQVQAMQHALAAHIQALPPLADKNSTEFWLQRWLEKNPQAHAGLLTLYFLNLVQVPPGAAVYQPAGLLHAYLEGQNVELMANSDNVLRAGLTPKHIDVPELLRVCHLRPTDPADYRITPTIAPNGEWRYVTPFAEFELSELNSRQGTSVRWRSETPEVLFCYAGEAVLRGAAGAELTLARGETLLVLPGADLSLQFCSPSTCIFKARNI